MVENLRRMPLAQATDLAKQLAISYAEVERIEGIFAEAKPGTFCNEHIGKVPAQWVAIFESSPNDKSFDTFIILQVDLVAKSVAVFPTL